MPKKPTPADASVILQLYDLRREAELRKARNWWLAEFWPETAADFLKVAQAIGTPKNNWLRQVSSYWELAASVSKTGQERLRVVEQRLAARREQMKEGGVRT